MDFSHTCSALALPRPFLGDRTRDPKCAGGGSRPLDRSRPRHQNRCLASTTQTPRLPRLAGKTGEDSLYKGIKGIK